MDYTELLNNGYNKIGNWFIKDKISINLMSETLKEITTGLFIKINRKNLTIDKIDKLTEAIKELS